MVVDTRTVGKHGLIIGKQIAVIIKYKFCHLSWLLISSNQLIERQQNERKSGGNHEVN